jgi:hypothetical protein
MLEKKESRIIAFPSTTMALKMEKCCLEQNRTGRLIPLPRELSAGCGLAWCEPVGTGIVLLDFLKKNEIIYEKIVKMEF